jgi:hypothetical protein
MFANARVYEPLRDSKRFVVELPQDNQVSRPTQTRCQQWLIHAVVCWLFIRFQYLPNPVVRLCNPHNFWSGSQTIFVDGLMIQLPF